MKQKKAQWPWHLLTVLVLVGLAGAVLRHLADVLRMALEPRAAVLRLSGRRGPARRDISTVVELVRKGDVAEVTLRNDAGSEQT
jgi:polar amino acid transport system permease protein